MDALIELLFNMDVLLLSLSIAFTFIIGGHLSSLASAKVIDKSNQLKETKGSRFKQLIEDPHLVQNYCFIRNNIALQMFKKESPDDKEDQLNSLFA
jgi:hypothetical protein